LLPAGDLDRQGLVGPMAMRAPRERKVGPLGSDGRR
jgi:hypothetical protein